jgi:hypothetical protein
MLFEGTLKICNLQDTAGPGEMPTEKLVVQSYHYYGDRTIGYGRQYAAMGVEQQVDRLVRIWRDESVHVRQYALLDDGQQYRIDMVQHLTDEDGLKVTDLTLFRLDDNFDVEGVDG